MRSSSKPLVAIVVSLLVSACSAPAQKPAESAQPPLKDVRNLVERASAFAAAGDHTRAEQYFGAALAAGGDRKQILPPLIEACVAAGHLRLAAEYAEYALAAEPDSAYLHFLSGAIHAALGERAKAREHLTLAAASLPSNAEVQFTVAAFHRDYMGDRFGSDPYFRRYLEIEPRGKHAAEARASLLERLR